MKTLKIKVVHELTLLEIARVIASNGGIGNTRSNILGQLKEHLRETAETFEDWDFSEEEIRIAEKIALKLFPELNNDNCQNNLG